MATKVFDFSIPVNLHTLPHPLNSWVCKTLFNFFIFVRIYQPLLQCWQYSTILQLVLYRQMSMLIAWEEVSSKCKDVNIINNFSSKMSFINERFTALLHCYHFNFFMCCALVLFQCYVAIRNLNQDILWAGSNKDMTKCSIENLCGYMLGDNMYNLDLVMRTSYCLVHWRLRSLQSKSISQIFCPLDLGWFFNTVLFVSIEHQINDFRA